MSLKDLPTPRRIVTAIDENGLSYFAEDGPPPRIISTPERPGYRNINIWRTLGRVDDPDTILEQAGVLPPKDGVVIRVVDVPPLPKDPEEAKRQAAATFGKIFPDAVHDTSGKRSANMHITDSVDFAVVLAGEIVAIMDRGETTMRAGDILIQRGTNHAWENRTDAPARMLFILCDAER